MDALWHIQLLGRLRVRQEDRVVSRFRTQKTAGVLAYLAYHRRSIPRDAVIEVFWPEAELESARHSLSMALSALRSVLEPPGIAAGSVIVADRSTLELNPDSFTTDVAEFERSLRLAAQAPDDTKRSRHLREAIETYAGPLLPEFYEEWVLAEQERLAERLIQAIGRQVEILTKAGETGEALELARHSVSLDPLREPLHAELIRLLVASGQVEAAIRQYRELERVLAQELAARPSPALQAQMRSLEARQATSTPGPLVTAPAPVPSGPVAVTLPVGTVTFLLTDIEGSTRRWAQEGELFRVVLGLHHAALRREFKRHGGHEFKETGDGFLVAFAGASEALECALAAQKALSQLDCPGDLAAPKVRMALHTGDAELEDGDYRGQTLHRAARVLAAAHGGQTLCSEATFTLLRRDLTAGVRLRDLGVYRLRDIEAPERLYQVEPASEAPAEFPPIRAERAHRGNLPVQTTRFFGRETELAELCRLLRASNDEERLITLTGPGGAGKSRLAIETAGRLVDVFGGAVWFVPLADLSDPRLLPETLASALRVQQEPGNDLLEQLAEVLGQRPSLLVLDNLEQLIRGDDAADASLVVQRLLELAPKLTLLATSRRVLALPGERELPVPPLSTPAEAAAPEALSVFDSVRLFVDRAQGVRPDFRVTNQNAPAVAQLCARLEGIPLALELAASRAQVLSPAQMLEQLTSGPSGRFELLTTRRRGVVDRQKALRTTIDWSYRLLSQDLQRFFRRLAVFRGSFDLAASEAVCEEPLAIDFVAMLLECSLVQTEEGPDGLRFRLLETLRDYAQERMMEAEEEAGAIERHAAFYLGRAEQGETALRGPEQASWLERLEADHENFRAVLSRAFHHGNTETRRDSERTRNSVSGTRLVAALWYFWSIRGHLAEGRRWCEAALRAVDGSLNSLRARLLTGAGALAHDQSDYPAAVEALTESLTLWRGTEPSASTTAGLAQALLILANVRLDLNEAEPAQALYEEARALYRELGDSRGAAMALSNLGVLHLERGETDRAAELLNESIQLKRKLGNPYGLAMSLESLGNLERSRGNRERAIALCREALALRQEVGHRLGIAMSLNNLGHLLLETGDSQSARERLLESLDLFLELDEPRSVIEALTGLAGTMAATGRYEDAARLLAAMETQREVSGFEPRPCEKVVLMRWRGSIREALDETLQGKLAWEGAGLSLQEAAAIGRC